LIIADAPPRPDRHHDLVAWLAGAVAIIIGVFAAGYYAAVGLTLSHYDARAHLVVARRVIDSLTPGWKQIGAVWLPLPHLLQLLPTQIDAFYRTGYFAVGCSVLAFGVLAYTCARLVLDATGSRLGVVAGLPVLLLNPDLLYLQATPMTEPLLLALATLSVAMLARWVSSDGRVGGTSTGLTLAAACLTRYEAWPITALALALATVALWRRGARPFDAVMATARVAAFPLAAALLFVLQSRLTVGHWFVTDGFYVPDNPDTGRPFKTIGSIWWASHHLNGYGVLLCAVAGAAAILVVSLASPGRGSSLVVLALAGSAALPWYAFYSGHPFRFRYMVPLVPALAVWAGIAIGLIGWTRVRAVAAAALVLLTLAETRPFDPSAPMVLEAQLDREHSRQRVAVSAYLAAHRQGEKILASLGSLSHFVQELSATRVNVRDVVHEGNGDLWAAALERPSVHVGWILIEELSEGGDVLARRARQDPGFLAGFTRVAEGGGVALYRNSRLAAAGPQWAWM
jgi:hypothetical protein